MELKRLTVYIFFINKLINVNELQFYLPPVAVYTSTWKNSMHIHRYVNFLGSSTVLLFKLIYKV